jgi:hypothetical protein
MRTQRESLIPTATRAGRTRLTLVSVVLQVVFGAFR